MNIFKHGAVALLALGLVACDSEGEGTDDGSTAVDRTAEIASLATDTVNGEAYYQANCSVCHGPNGEGVSGPALSGEVLEDVIDVVLEGPGSMPSFDDRPDQDLADVAAYVVETF